MPSPSNKSSKGKDSKGDPKTPKEGRSDKSSLPFEPGSNRKKAPKQPAAAVAKEPEKEPEKQEKAAKPAQSAGKKSSVPEAVSRRMARRMGVFCGIPTSLGMLTFIVSYLVVTNHWFKLPNVAVVLLSMGFFGLGVLGLSYGVLSASWDEERVGSLLGWEEFTVNFGRVLESWRTAKQKPQP